jgi:lipopolysaccharide assembly outer membrane protein LptD (OstA)
LDKLVRINRLLFVLILFIINFSGSNFISLNIESKNADIILDKSIVIFYNSVVINYKNLKINADKATVFIRKDSKVVEKVIIENNIRIYSDNSEISANNIVIEPSTNKITINGNVKTKIKSNLD